LAFHVFQSAHKLVYVPVQTQDSLQSEEHFRPKASALTSASTLRLPACRSSRSQRAILSATKGIFPHGIPAAKRIWRVDRPTVANGGHSAPRKYRFEGTAQGNLEAYRAETVKALVRRRASGVVPLP